MRDTELRSAIFVQTEVLPSTHFWKK